MPKLEALTEIRYGGKTVNKGETFEVLEKDVKILKAIKKAQDPNPEPPKTQKRPPATKAADTVVEPKPAEPTQPWVAPATAVAPMTMEKDDPAGRYRRRDMKPED